MSGWSYIIPGAATGCILFFYGIFFLDKRKVSKYRIEPDRPLEKIKTGEYVMSLTSLLVFGAAGWLMDWEIETGKATVATDFKHFSLLYQIGTGFLLFLLYDIYFYLTHRLLHLPFLFRYFHKYHHRYHHPNPFTAFAFHPLEAVITIGFIPLIILLLPVSFYTLLFFVVFLMFLSVYGHSAHELRANKSGIFKIFNTSVHHYQHHKYVQCNYGIILNLWDRWLGSSYVKASEDVNSG